MMTCEPLVPKPQTLSHSHGGYALLQLLSPHRSTVAEVFLNGLAEGRQSSPLDACLFALTLMPAPQGVALRGGRIRRRPLKSRIPATTPHMSSFCQSWVGCPFCSALPASIWSRFPNHDPSSRKDEHMSCFCLSWVSISGSFRCGADPHIRLQLRGRRESGGRSAAAVGGVPGAVPGGLRESATKGGQREKG